VYFFPVGGSIILANLTLFNCIKKCSDEESVVDEADDDADDVLEQQGVVGALRRERRTFNPLLLLAISSTC